MPDAMGFQTLDEMAREGVKAGTLKKAVVIEGSTLPEAEQKHIEDIGEFAAHDEAWFRTHPVEGTVTTGAELWAANGGRSPFPDQMQRLTDGKYCYPLDEDGEIVPGMVEEVTTGKRITMAVFEARRTLELAGL